MFTPRLEIPPKDNRYYIAKSEGGLNPCIPRPSGSKLRFANCVFYAVGRFAEITGIWLKSTNAENFIAVASTLDEDLIYLTEVSDKLREGQKVIVKEGPFKGVEGKVVRIRKSRRIMVEIPGMLAVASTYVEMGNVEII